uniref:kelch repeat-containing protein n=1 Tax=Pedobacter schmidteae TaxID=2201271 RepID=UPI001D018CC1|nr:kelch repeat-containing protein [Pedobacter schmidteae]
MLTTKLVFAQKTKVPVVEWSTAAQLQDTRGKVSLGYAGAINAVYNNQLIIAGGANFPDNMPWEGGRKHYSDEIHVLKRAGNDFVWIPVADRLPEPIAYCGNTSTPAGVVYAGGENEKGLSDKTYLLNWDDINGQMVIKQLPNLPLVLTNVSLTSIENVVYAVGGDMHSKSADSFFSINLLDLQRGWTTLPPLPKALANAIVVIQKKDKGRGVYVIGGRTKTSSGISNLHHTTFVFDVKNANWSQLAAISDGKDKINFSAGAGVPIADHLILVAGGDNGKVFRRIESYMAQIAMTENIAEKARLIKEKNDLVIHHKGFDKSMLMYNTLTNHWNKIGELPFPARVTTTATLWNGEIMLSSGEIQPGIRTPDIMRGKIK